MRIAYVTETWPPEVNGVAMTAARTVAYLRERGHQVDLVRPRQGGELKADNALLMPSVPIPLYRDLRMGLPAQRRLARYWQQTRPDLVHVATEGPLGWTAISAARELGLPRTSDFRTRFDAYTRYYAPGFLTSTVTNYLRHFHNRCALTFVPTLELRRSLAKLGFENMVVSARGVDCQFFDPAWRSDALRAHWGARGPVALTVGRLAREKNLILAVRAYHAMRAREPNLRWVVVGDGPFAGALTRLCPDALLVGTQRGQDLARHFASADLFLFPSLTETFGNVTLEAMASGLPVVAYRTAAAAMHVQSGINGFVATPGHEAGFIRDAVQLAGDAALRSRLGAAARATALTLDWNQVLGAFETELLRVAGIPMAYEHALVA